MADKPEIPKLLLDIRSRKDLKLKPCKLLKQTFTDFDGSEKPLKIRYYQAQGILHLVACKRFLLGDDTGLGKTLQVISALCYVWDKAPDTKAIVLTTKSAAPQWEGEFAKFTTGVKAILCQGTAAQRAAARKEFEESTGPVVLIMGYRSAVQDFSDMQEWLGHIVVYDEATAFKNPKTQVHQVCQHLANRASRVWALTATLIKNHLIEGYGIYRVVAPGLFPPNVLAFMHYYCIVEMRSVPRSARKIPVILGYLPDKIQEFKDQIAPFYLGRPKHEVATELPVLTSRVIEVALTDPQGSKYHEALTGLLEVGDARGAGNVEAKEVTKLTAITYCQQICNHLELLDCEGPSSKLTALMDLLTDGELEGEKVIIFTRFKGMVDILMREFKKAKIPAVRITGDEDGQERRAAMKSFQDPSSDTRVVCITMAGSDAINLQAAKAIIFFDTPWSAGDFLQILGRMIRIGTAHDRVYSIHLVAKWRKRTVDQRIMEVLGKKMQLVESVLGQRLKAEGGMTADPDLGQDAEYITVQNELNDLYQALRDDARE